MNIVTPAGKVGDVRLNWMTVEAYEVHVDGTYCGWVRKQANADGWLANPVTCIGLTLETREEAIRYVVSRAA